MAQLSPRARTAAMVETLRSSLWPVPLALVVAAMALAVMSLKLDRTGRGDVMPSWIFHAGPDGARSTLTAIATSIMTLAGISISMTAVVLQLASNQFSPRVVRTFLRDWLIQLVFGTYVGTFAFTILVLRSIRSKVQDHEDFVAPLSVSVAVLLALTCVIVLVVFFHHIGRSLQLSAIVDRVARETKTTIEHVYPEQIEDDDPAPAAARTRSEPWPVHAPTEGYLAYVDYDGFDLREGVVAIDIYVGDFVRRGDVVARVWSRERPKDDDVADALVLATERTMQQDVRFGLQLLSDVALRALSPGINDPTTAVYCVNTVSDLLCRLVVRGAPALVRSEGDLCVISRRPDLDEIVRVGFEPIIVFGHSDARVLDALLEALEALLRHDARGSSRGVVDELVSAIDVAAKGATGWTERQRCAVRKRCADVRAKAAAPVSAV